MEPNSVIDKSFHAIEPHTGSIVARSIVNFAASHVGGDLDAGGSKEITAFMEQVDAGLRAFLADRSLAESILKNVGQALGVTAQVGGIAPTLLAAAAASAVEQVERIVPIREEYDIVIARGECKTLCAKAGFTSLEQVKIATVVSELARNIVQYAGTGEVRIATVALPRPGIEIEASDRGKGIPNIDAILGGEYESKTGMGVGILGARRLMDEFKLDTGPTGTRIRARKYVS